jgi:hypothetical protein
MEYLQRLTRTAGCTGMREIMTDPVNIGIIICNRYHTCAGGKYLRSLGARVGAFRLYQGRNVALVGYTTCDGCPGGKRGACSGGDDQKRRESCAPGYGPSCRVPPMSVHRQLLRVHPHQVRSYGGHRHPSDSSKILSDAPGIGNLGLSGMARENQAYRGRRSHTATIRLGTVMVLRVGLAVRIWKASPREEKPL